MVPRSVNPGPGRIGEAVEYAPRALRDQATIEQRRVNRNLGRSPVAKQLHDATCPEVVQAAPSGQPGDARVVQRYKTASILSSFLMPARPAR